MTEVVSARIVTARKQHRCCWCEEPIYIGERHYVLTGVFDFQWDRWRSCRFCTDFVAKHFERWEMDRLELGDYLDGGMFKERVQEHYGDLIGHTAHAERRGQRWH